MIFTHQHFIPSYGSAHINCTLYPVPLFCAPAINVCCSSGGILLQLYEFVGGCSKQRFVMLNL